LKLAAITPVVVGYTNSYSTTSFSHTVPSGSDRLLLVSISNYPRTSSVSGITYNGVALTLARKQNGNTGGSGNELWYLVAPDVGTASVAISWTAGSVASQWNTTATNITGIHQTDPLIVVSGANGGASNDVTVDDGPCLVWDVCGHTASTRVAAADNTALHATPPYNGINYQYDFYRIEPTGGTYFVGATSTMWNHAIAAFRSSDPGYTTPINTVHNAQSVSTSTTTENVTVPSLGSNGLYLFALSSLNSVTVTGVTIGGQAMTQAVMGPGASIDLSWWYLVNPPSGSQPLRFTSALTSVYYVSVFLEDVDQTTPIASTADTAGNNISALTISPTAGNMVFSIGANQGASGPLGVNALENFSFGSTNITVGARVAPGGSITVGSDNSTSTSTSDWGAAAIEVVPASGGGSVSTEPTDLSAAHDIEPATISQTFGALAITPTALDAALALAPASISQTIPSVSVTLNDLDAATAIDAVTIGQHQAVTVTSLQFAPELGAASIAQQVAITPTSLTAGIELAPATIAQTITVAPTDLSAAVDLTAPTIAPHIVSLAVSVTDLSTAVALDPTTIDQTSTISPTSLEIAPDISPASITYNVEAVAVAVTDFSIITDLTAATAEVQIGNIDVSVSPLDLGHDLAAVTAETQITTIAVAVSPLNAGVDIGAAIAEAQIGNIDVSVSPLDLGHDLAAVTAEAQITTIAVSVTDLSTSTDLSRSAIGQHQAAAPTDINLGFDGSSVTLSQHVPITATGLSSGLTISPVGLSQHLPITATPISTGVSLSPVTLSQTVTVAVSDTSIGIAADSPTVDQIIVSSGITTNPVRIGPEISAATITQTVNLAISPLNVGSELGSVSISQQIPVAVNSIDVAPALSAATATQVIATTGVAPTSLLVGSQISPATTTYHVGTIALTPTDIDIGHTLDATSADQRSHPQPTEIAAGTDIESASITQKQVIGASSLDLGNVISAATTVTVGTALPVNPLASSFGITLSPISLTVHVFGPQPTPIKRVMRVGLEVRRIEALPSSRRIRWEA
jgi:hypothetical protein